MILIDTGYFVALAVANDQHRARAIRWAQRLAGPLVVTEYVMLETVNALSRRAWRPAAVAIADTVRTDGRYTWVPASADLWAAGLDYYRQRADKDWSLTDCTSFHVMADRGIRSALTYDHHFEQAGFEPLLRREP